MPTQPAEGSGTSMLVTLLQTKLDAPSLRSGLVRRQRLTARLDGGLAARLSLVVAPAGFGKTTLVGEWVNHMRNSGTMAWNVAWLSLDELDNEPFRFVAHLIAALQTVEPTLGNAAQALLSSSQLPSAEMVMTVLINDFAAVSTPVALVLDDYHVIRVEWVHSATHFLLDHQPPSLHLVLIGREDPPLPLSRLRARRELAEALLMRFAPQAFAEAVPTPSPAAAPSPAAPPALEHRAELLPSACPRCGAPVRGAEVKWVGPQSADCPYYGAHLPMRAN